MRNNGGRTAGRKILRRGPRRSRGRLDALIVGGGPAGLTAGFYLSRAGFRTALIERAGIGGQAARIPKLRNYPGFYVMFRTVQYLKGRPSPQKASDTFDTIYMALIPYVTLYTCDNDIMEAVRHVVKASRIDMRTEVVNMREFLRMVNQ